MDNKKNKILIVDDNPKNLQVLGNLLEKNEYNVEHALNGKEALEWINAEKFDLILLDVMMPEMDGFEVCNIIRKRKELDDVPIIFLTAKTDKISIVKGFELNAQDYINKPFDSAELIARIKTHLELKNSKDKLKNVNVWLEQKVDEKTKELQETNKKLEKAFTELQNLDKMKSYFLNLTSTEIRAPLSGIIGTLHLLKNQEAASTIKDLLDLLEKSISRLENFANKAILTTELSSKSYDLKKENISIHELVQYTLLELQDIILEKQIEIIDEYDESIIISCDKNLMYKAYLFIVKSAVERSSEQSKINISVRKENEKAICSFLDYGKGFDQEEIENIYSPYRFKEENIHKNYELSMYLLKLIMDAHGFKIKVYNKENAGACIELEFYLDLNNI